MNRYIQQRPVLPTKKKDKIKREISQPNKYNKEIMAKAKPIYTGRGTVG